MSDYLEVFVVGQLVPDSLAQEVKDHFRHIGYSNVGSIVEFILSRLGLPSSGVILSGNPDGVRAAGALLFQQVRLVKHDTETTISHPTAPPLAHGGGR